MRDETYYYASGNSLEQSKGIKFGARELVEQVLESGYMIEGICNLSSSVLIMDVLRRRDLLPRDLWTEWKDEIFADKIRVKELEKSGQIIRYHFGISDNFRKSQHYWHWLNSIYPKMKTETIYCESVEGQQGEKLPYLLTERGGKATMFEYLKNEIKIPFSNISLENKKVYELISDWIKFGGHPYLPEDLGFDLGIRGYPGVGTKCCIQVLQERGTIVDFKNFVETTREVLSFVATGDENVTCVRREVSITEAVLESLVAYYMAWCCLYDNDVWNEAYQRAYLNSISLEKWKSGNRDEINYYKDYLTSLPMDIDTVIQFMEKISIKEGILAIEGYGLLVLQGTYYDFWKWLYEEQEFQKDDILTNIACYAENSKVRENKQKLLGAVEKYDAYTFSNIVVPVHFHSDKPMLGYGQRRRMVVKNVEVERNQYLKKLQKYSHYFTKFSIETESAALFRQSSEKECQRYLREIDSYDLCRAFILYYPAQRDWIMKTISLRLQNMLLEDMKWYVQGEQFSLDACVQSENKITGIIRMIKEKS